MGSLERTSSLPTPTKLARTGVLLSPRGSLMNVGLEDGLDDDLLSPVVHVIKDGSASGSGRLEHGVSASFLSLELLKARQVNDSLKKEKDDLVDQKSDLQNGFLQVKELNESLERQKQALKTQLAYTEQNLALREGDIQGLTTTIQDRSHVESIQASYNNLLSKYDTVKLDAENYHTNCEKLQVELQRSKSDHDKIQKELDIRIDKLGLAEIDKSMAEENLYIVNEELASLKIMNEELVLEKELSTEEFNGAGKILLLIKGDRKGITDSHQLSIQNERLTDALIRLRDVGIVKESELTDKLTLREMEIVRLRDLDDIQNELENKLLKANEKITHLKGQVDNVVDSTVLITALTESNLSLDEVIGNMVNIRAWLGRILNFWN